MNYLREMAEQGYNPQNIDSFHEVMVPWLLSFNGVSKDGTVVDIGAGQGHALIPLHRNEYKHLVAVDIDDFNFDFFERKYGFKTIQCNIASQPLELKSSSVGAIIALHLIEHLRDPANLLKESHRVLKPGGKLFLVTPDWRKQYKTFWRDPTHLRPYDKVSISRVLRMYEFIPRVSSWNARFGFGRLQAYKWFPKLGMIGLDLLAIGTKTDDV